MKKIFLGAVGALFVGVILWIAFDKDSVPCIESVASGIPSIADERADRFQGKASDAAGACRGGPDWATIHDTPWVDWQTYWAAGDETSLPDLKPPSHSIVSVMTRAERGYLGSLVDLERARIELVKFNLFDSLTYAHYLNGKKGQDGKTVDGRAIKVWDEMRISNNRLLNQTDPQLGAIKNRGGTEICTGALIRFRTQSGICNDILNPAMGSTGMPFGRNVPFEATFPDLGLTPEAKARHAGRIDVMTPDPQLVSQKLFTRRQSDPAACAGGYGTKCDYEKANTLNVLAAFWIQFMTHDWFSHLDEGRNSTTPERLGCKPGSTGCDPDMMVEKPLTYDTGPQMVPRTGTQHMPHAPTVTANLVTAWWDGSQIYGYSDASAGRVKRDSVDPAKLLLVDVPEREARGDDGQYLPLLATNAPMNPKWAGQEAAAFPENWNIGLSFLHTVFVREHNAFVTAFREQAKNFGSVDSGLRRPEAPNKVVTYAEVTDEELFQVARLVVAAEMAKIHTTEWTPQLLYNEPLRTAMFSNWFGLTVDQPWMKRATAAIAETMKASSNPQVATSWFSAVAAAPGIVGMGTVGKPDKKSSTVNDVSYVNGGTEHFGVPFNFTEEFVSVYRLHSLVPDLIELRNARKPNVITSTLPMVQTFRAKATGAMHDIGLADLAFSFGRQRAGSLSLGNHPAFLQNLNLEDPATPGRTLDIPALDILRDRERGVPRFNEFRRQIGLPPLKSFNDFIDQRLKNAKYLTPEEAATLARQQDLALTLREVYGVHTCDRSKIISTALKVPDADGTPRLQDDCLGNDPINPVDNVEDLDTVVGYLAESTRPHGFAISETQFQIFIINASRRLFSDRFFTSSYRKEFYTQFGLDWVNHNGPAKANGPIQPPSPMVSVLMRAMPEFAPQLAQVTNAFDPWGRERGPYYATDWTPRSDAKDDLSFAE